MATEDTDERAKFSYMLPQFLFFKKEKLHDLLGLLHEQVNFPAPQAHSLP
jgi:hypothetical protein